MTKGGWTITVSKAVATNGYVKVIAVNGCRVLHREVPEGAVQAFDPEAAWQQGSARSTRKAG